MTVDTSKVTERRTLRFESLDEIVTDAERLVAAPKVRMLGNWPLEDLFLHLATAINGSLDGIDVRAPWFIRLIAPVFKRRVLTKSMRAGFKLPVSAQTDLFPKGKSVAESLESLRSAVARQHSQPMAASHPVFGRLTHDEWRQLHLRHAELHLSFAIPLAE
ncbi:MAG TPA: DUF1569 domain-containing protein [Planctomycetaceae bacterium]|nr:DUF1569 domain-containing protein [Planctomycetaceae bacterium]